ncbi:MAG: hypothetical protein JW785_06130 [Acidimicrobiia bacterium]|nr:hypothetical protein [Acidimicrobiia bacterium]
MRRMHVFTTDGVETLPIRSDEAASVVGRHWNAVKAYLGTGDARAFDDFRGLTVRGRQLETDPDAVDDLAVAGDLDILDIYDLPPEATQ